METVRALMAAAIGLAACGAGALEIVHEATPVGERMAEELRRYLPELRIGGAPVRTVYLGDTEFARANGVEAQQMEADSYRIRGVRDELIIAGGGSRGTVYGVFGFLEKYRGLRIWSPLEEWVPEKSAVDLPELDEEGRFFFALRDIYKTGVPADGGRAAMARGFSRNGDAGIVPEFGGGWEYGPPYSCHTFDRYLPAAEYLAAHPEFYSLVDGKRVGGQLEGQLCLTNPAMRRFFAARLLEMIAQAEAKAAADGVPAPRIYDVSHNDNTNFCRCEACAAFAAREGQSGLMVDFVNELARQVREHDPELLLQTFAYQYTLEPPASVLPEENVVIRLCNTGSDRIAGVSGNPEFQRQLAEWAEIAPQLFVWDYAIVFGDATGLPFPSEYYYPDNYRYYADHKVKGIFWEQECADRSDMAELKYFLHGKYMQEPRRDDFEALLDDFYSGYYGSAAPWIRHYRELLYRAARERQAWISWFPSAGDFRYIDWPTMLEAQRLLAQARQAADFENMLLRVNRAAAGLDRLLGFELTSDYLAAAEAQNPEIDAVAWVEAARDRVCDTLIRSADAGWLIPERDKLLTRFHHIRLLPLRQDAPEKFRAIPHADRPAGILGCLLDHAFLRPDPEAESGAAVVLEIDSAKPGVYANSVTIGVYNPVRSSGVASVELPRTQTATAGYQWYCLRNVQLPEDNCYLYLSPSWGVQLALGDTSPLPRRQPLDIWVNMKVTGALFHPGSTENDRIYFSRVVLTAAGAVK